MIFITGATGLLGSHLAKNLIAKGEQVTALKRSTSNLALLGEYANKITWIEGDLSNIDALNEATKNAEKVFHCAALISFLKKDRTALYKTNVEGTANVMNAALENGVKKLVHVSSVAAFGFSKKGETISEKTVYDEEKGLAYYFKSKHFGEREAWRAQAEGLNVVIANPSTILGGGWWNVEPNNLFLQLKKKMPFYTQGSNGFVDVRDVAKALEILMEKAESGSQYIISAENHSFKNLLSLIAETLQVPTPSIGLNYPLAKAAILYSSLSSLLLNKKPLLTNDKYLIANSNFKYNNQHFVQDFSFQYIPIKETIKSTCVLLNNSLQKGEKFGIL